MATKKPNLAAALAKEPEQAPAAEPTPVPGPSNDRSRRPAARQANREGKVNVSGWFPQAVKFQLDELRLKQSREKGRRVTLEQLQAEALNDLFKKYGMAEIAPSVDG